MNDHGIYIFWWEIDKECLVNKDELVKAARITFPERNILKHMYPFSFKSVLDVICRRVKEPKQRMIISSKHKDYVAAVLLDDNFSEDSLWSDSQRVQAITLTKTVPYMLRLETQYKASAINELFETFKNFHNKKTINEWLRNYIQKELSAIRVRFRSSVNLLPAAHIPIIDRIQEMFDMADPTQGVRLCYFQLTDTEQSRELLYEKFMATYGSRVSKIVKKDDLDDPEAITEHSSRWRTTCSKPYRQRLEDWKNVLGDKYYALKDTLEATIDFLEKANKNTTKRIEKEEEEKAEAKRRRAEEKKKQIVDKTKKRPTTILDMMAEVEEETKVSDGNSNR